MQNFAFGFANVVINLLYKGDILDNFKNSCFFKWFSIRLNLWLDDFPRFEIVKKFWKFTEFTYFLISFKFKMCIIIDIWINDTVNIW